jgi:hypothetical protein
MSIFEDLSTPGWGILIKSLRDAKLASISNRNALAKTTQSSRRAFRPDMFAILAPQVRWRGVQTLLHSRPNITLAIGPEIGNVPQLSPSSGESDSIARHQARGLD